jgi:predicted ATPase
LSQENGFEVWYAVGTIHLGYAKALLNETEESISILEQVLNLYEATGARSVMAYFLTGLVEAYRRAGNLDAALLTVEKALAHAEQFGHHMYDSLLHRLHGELLMAMSDSQHGAAEDAFSTAIVAARRRQAHQLELEATLALHKLHIASGEPHKSREMLADVCSWFDDDVETTALTDARQYLGTPVGT